MRELVLTPEQSNAIAAAIGPITVKNAAGNVLGHLDPILTAEVVAEMKRSAREGPWYTSQQVKARMAALEAEWQRTGGFDREYMHAFLDRLRATDPPHTGPVTRA